VADRAKAVRKFRRELNSGLISLLLLATFAGSRKPLYGYQIAKSLASLCRGPLPMQHGALYPVLRSLDAAGLLSSTVEPSVAGPPRRYYRITDAGRQTLQEWRAIWDSTRSLVDSVLTGGAA